MSTPVPSEIAGLGSTAMKLRVSPGFDPLKAQVGPDEYFVLSRIDGSQTLREVLLATGLPIDRAIAIVTKLRSIGALLLPGETTAPSPAAAPAKPTPPRTVTPSSPPTPPTGLPMSRAPTPVIPAQLRPPLRAPDLDPPTVRRPVSPVVVDAPTARLPPGLVSPPPAAKPTAGRDLPNPTRDEQRMLDEPGDLSAADRRTILAMCRLLDDRDPWALLGVAKGADAKTLKRAYFMLSKEIHPDRYYGKQLGSFAERLPQAFEAVSRAYAKLTTPEKSRSTSAHQQVAEQPQTPQEYAAELFDRACGLEVSGDAMGAMKLFAAAVRIDSQTRYLRRAASCALAARQPKTAVEYAKKAQVQAPEDPSSARLLASAFKAAGKLADAEEVLIMAMALKSENDVLTSELRNDLAEVRRMLAG